MEDKPRQINIQSKDHEKLLNVIDDLRSQGISRFIDLPQIIVCGDQSSGKSSVLEGVSGLKFPTKDALCTRFATELILRRHTEITSSVSIVPDANRPDEEKKRLKEFENEGDIYENLGDIITRAGEAMGLDGTSKTFSSDVLRIELSGPEQPHLTLVDLPGLFHSGSKSQSDADAEAVKSLVISYMQKSRSIILAVISAKNDFNNQIVTKFAKDHDSEGLRTLGIITKPDTLPAGSDSEKQFLELAENKDVNFGLGWHVLKNRDYQQRNCSNKERDASEKEFFNHGIWTSLSPLQLGIDTLRPRLSKVLQNQILRELPSLLSDVKAGIHSCESRLQLLGASRGTHQEQRVHLHSASEAFSRIISNAVDGLYNDEYFGSAENDLDYTKRIRAITTNMIGNFSGDAGRRGHKYEIVSEPPAKPSKHFPFKVTREERMIGIKQLIERNRGKELATVAKEENITALFREQSSPWGELAKKHADKIFAVVKDSVHLALESSCDRSTQEGILSHIINPRLAQTKTDFDAAVDKILEPHIKDHPITQNHYLSENLQNMRNTNDEKRLRTALTKYFGIDPYSENHFTNPVKVNTRALLQTLLKSNEADMMKFSCEEALSIMEAYYKVALKKFIDDFASYAVERELVKKLDGLFTTSTVLNLKDDIIEEIAGETEESRLERAQSEKKLATLNTALGVLMKLDRANARSKPSVERRKVVYRSRFAEDSTEDEDSDSSSDEQINN